MTTAEIIVIVLIGLILLFVGVTYLLHGIKIEKKNSQTKKESQKIETKQDAIKSEPEQAPVPVGIIKPEKPKQSEQSENSELDLAPLKDKPVEKPKENLGAKQIQDEIKNLSPEMKKIIMSDILKPKF
ncbi:MAG: hypothetical protein ACI4TI_00270 [Christensenellales bacterium]